MRVNTDYVEQITKTGTYECDGDEIDTDSLHDDLAADLLDARAEVAKLTEQRDALRAALAEIAEGRGRFSLDHHEHAMNTIEDMKAIACGALGGGR